MLLCLIFLCSLPVKLLAAQNMVWDMDMIPVIARGLAFFETGNFPVYGTLSSVAAYNMPFLVWLQMPAMLITHDPFQIMLITQQVFNFLTTFFIYRTGHMMFSARIGLLAATLFTFSETGVSGSYTAWAQLLLPGFFIMVFYCLWQWSSQKKGVYLACAGVAATCAVMTHFAAIMLLPAMLIFALLSEAHWQWRWLASGILVCSILLAPYLSFEAQRDFADIRAFLSRDTLVTPDIMTQYETIKPGGNLTEAEVNTAPSTSQNPSVIAPDPPENPSRLQRAFSRIFAIPGQIITSPRITFSFEMRSLTNPLSTISQAYNSLFYMLVLLSFPLALFRAIHHLRKNNFTQLRKSLVTTSAGRTLLIHFFMLCIVPGYILTRATPAIQPTYYYGLISLHFLIVAIALDTICATVIKRKAIQSGLLIIIVAGFIGLAITDRVQRVISHNDETYSAYNVWLYRRIETVAGWIAEDWSGDNQPTISYDILPEMRHMWWILPWNTVDDLYRMGTPYDFLLHHNHGLINQNTQADGLTNGYDYLIVYEPGLERYELSGFDIEQFGAIYVLKAAS